MTPLPNGSAPDGALTRCSRGAGKCGPTSGTSRVGWGRTDTGTGRGSVARTAGAGDECSPLTDLGLLTASPVSFTRA